MAPLPSSKPVASMICCCGRGGGDGGGETPGGGGGDGGAGGGGGMGGQSPHAWQRHVSHAGDAGSSVHLCVQRRTSSAALTLASKLAAPHAQSRLILGGPSFLEVE